MDNYGMTLMSLSRLSQVKGISVFTLRKYARQEGMPHYRCGNKYLVDPVKFDEWLERKKNNKPVLEIQDSLDDLWTEVLKEIG